MSRKSIGIATEVFDIHTSAADKTAILPYGGRLFSVLFDNEELDLLCRQGFERVLSKQPREVFNFYDYYVQVEPRGLPLMVAARSLHAYENGAYVDVAMAIGVVSMSFVDESRGVLHGLRHGCSGDWELERYEVAQPLKYIDVEDIPVTDR
jgi:hypothetical protein